MYEHEVNPLSVDKGVKREVIWRCESEDLSHILMTPTKLIMSDVAPSLSAVHGDVLLCQNQEAYVAFDLKKDVESGTWNCEWKKISLDGFPFANAMRSACID